MTQLIECGCSCGEVEFTVTSKPLFRGYCHCTICQQFNDAPYADITVFTADNLDVLSIPNVDFKVYQNPPLVRRGKCTSCGNPAVEAIRIMPLPRLVVVPSNNVRDQSLLPEPSIHIFYHRKVEEFNDQLPKHHGFIKSQLAFSNKLMGALFKRSRQH